MHTPTAAMLVIGDEILSGRTRDSNTNFLARALTDHGIRLTEARVVADEHDRIKQAVQALSAAYDHVFTSGGIGPTHDDITADAVADAMGAPIDIRDDARAILQAHYDARGQELNAARLRMARIPAGARLIDNPISAAPGFTIGNVHVMAGVPSIFEAMVASVMPTLTGGPPMLSQSLRVVRGEGDIAEALGRLAADHPEVSIGSYPFQRDGVHGSNIVVRSQDGPAVDAVMGALVRLFPATG
ncbi:competence/damage-inducible protein A [Roseicyclus mahoneyensis]|jgi:molybdenum cofactor synthesis domain-containing protein|uniref:Molybdenum cofactor synthesis domain-containing protein n=1 Tax=Roseicyclus mahoneyensis TaxID=164332 RepID=A0A316GLF1_9RHOB|nr:molybdopterin-binding protein [Roseicyclus mahoneyensis]PWK61662.1 molybdenum cofactor synthesis domain-containing protein [Roseicyclus mahoneyensis]